MGLKILREITSECQDSPFITVMADRTSDSSNKERVTLVICHVSEDLAVHKEFVGLYQVPCIDVNTFTTTIKDVLVRMNLSFVRTASATIVQVP